MPTTPTHELDGIELSGGHTRFVAADIGNANEIQTLVAEAGDIDIFMNNGGFSRFCPPPELGAEKFGDLFDATGAAAHWATKLARGVDPLLGCGLQPKRRAL